MGLSPVELKERWRREELCTACGCRDAIPDRSYCPKCRAKILKRYRARIASGVCVSCSNPSEEGLTHCAAHREAQNAYYAQSRDLLRSLS